MVFDDVLGDWFVVEVGMWRVYVLSALWYLYVVVLVLFVDVFDLLLFGIVGCRDLVGFLVDVFECFDWLFDVLILYMLWIYQ